MYILDFCKRITSKSNSTLLLYLIFNIILISLFMPGYSLVGKFLMAIVFYIISVILALSGIGEFIIRRNNGCYKIQRQDIRNFIEPIFNEVYMKAKRLDPSLPNDIGLYMNNDQVPNAFALGRKTVCITYGMLSLPEDQIKATLAHEFGHLSHKDTDILLVVSIGNFFVTVIAIAFSIIIKTIFLMLTIFNLIFVKRKFGFQIVNNSIRSINELVVASIMYIWTGIGMLMVKKSMRENEFKADEFAFNLGYGNALCRFFDTIRKKEQPRNFFGNLASTHPRTDDRIARLQQLGTRYSF